MEASRWVFRNAGQGALPDDAPHTSFAVMAPPITAPIARLAANFPRWRSGARKIPLRHAATPQYIKPVVRDRTILSSGTINDQDSCQRNLRIARKPWLP